MNFQLFIGGLILTLFLGMFIIVLVCVLDGEDDEDYYEAIELTNRPNSPAIIKSKEEFLQYLQNNWIGFTFSAWDVCPVNWDIAKTAAILRSFECSNKLVKVVVGRYAYFKLLA